MTDILKELSFHIYHNPGHDYVGAMIDAKQEIERLRHERRNLQRSWSAERAEVKRLRDAIDNIIMAADLPGNHCEMENAIAFARRALEGGQTDANT